MSLNPPKEALKMNCKSRPAPLPSLISPILDDSLLMDLRGQLKLSSLLSRAGIARRSGHRAGVLVFLHMLLRSISVRPVA